MQRFETNVGSLTVAVQSEAIVMVMSASKSSPFCKAARHELAECGDRGGFLFLGFACSKQLSDVSIWEHSLARV